MFDLGKVAAILDLHTTQCLRFFHPTTMSGIPESHMVYTKIMNRLQLRNKMALVYCLTLANDGHFGFSQFSIIPQW